MAWLKPALWLLTAALAAVTFWALSQVGFVGIFRGGLANPGAVQITVDLVIACTLLLGFIVRDCRAAGRPWWPWALLTAVAGSFGPLAYLLWPKPQKPAV